MTSPYKYNLAERDLYLSQIEDEINSKRKMLLSKRNKLEKIIKENEFLEGVKMDYEKYHNYIVKQKEEQIKALNILNQYFADLIVSGKLTEKDIYNTKNEQDEILGEMDQIKKDLDEIIQK
jgi:malate synthase